MLTKMLLTFALVAPTMASAGEQSTLGNELERYRCSDYDGDARGCEAQPQCNYDYIDRICNDRGGPGPGRSCSSYDNDPYTCNQQPFCEWDRWSRSCVDSNYPPPSRECYYYDNDPRLCDQTPGCYYDRRNSRCESSLDPGGDRPVTQTIRCDGTYGYAHCDVYGQVTNAYLMQQIGAYSCIEGRSWGADYNGIWVDRGCSGYFRVTYNSYYRH